MPIFEVEIGGKTYEVDAPDMNTAASAAGEFGGQQQQPEAQPQGTGGFRASKVGRALQGVADPLIGLVQLGMHVPNPMDILTPGIAAKKREMAGQVDEAVRENERAYDEARGPDAGFDWWRLGGNVASPVNLIGGAATLPTRGASLGARVATGAGSGALTAAMQPVTGENYADDKTAQILAGTLMGGALPVAGAAVGSVMNPTMSRNVQTLLDDGVPVTTGRRLGRVGATIEDKLRSAPIVGDAIAGAQRRGVEGLNRTAVNRALEPIGMALPDDVATGHDAVAYASRAIGGAYDNVLSRMSARPDQQFYNEVARIGRDLAQRVPPQQAQQFLGIVRGELGKFGAPGQFGRNLQTLNGDALKGIQRQLRTTAERMRLDPNYNTQEVGRAVGEALDSFMGLVQRTNPTEVPMLRAVDSAFANFARVRDAASSSASVDGVFSPATLNQAVRRGDKSSGKGATARGEALLQDLSNAAKDVLPQQVPNSGTVDRLLLNLGLLGGAGGYSESGLPGSDYALPLALALTAGGAAYTQPGQRALNALLFARPDLVRQLGTAAGRNAIALSPTAAILPSQNY